MDTDSPSYRNINRSEGGLKNDDDEMATEQPRASHRNLEYCCESV